MIRGASATRASKVNESKNVHEVSGLGEQARRAPLDDDRRMEEVASLCIWASSAFRAGDVGQNSLNEEYALILSSWFPRFHFNTLKPSCSGCERSKGEIIDLAFVPNDRDLIFGDGPIFLVLRLVDERALLDPRHHVAELCADLLYPVSDWSMCSGHHGYQRACDLISGETSSGLSGHQCSHAPGRPILHRRLILSQTSAGKTNAELRHR